MGRPLCGAGQWGDGPWEPCPQQGWGRAHMSWVCVPIVTGRRAPGGGVCVVPPPRVLGCTAVSGPRPPGAFIPLPQNRALGLGAVTGA